MNISLIQLSKTVSNRRKALGFTQVRLAAQVGVSLPALQQLESGKGNPSWLTLQRVCGSLGLEIDIHPRSTNWSLLIQGGVPLTQVAQDEDSPVFTRDLFLNELVGACESPIDQRQRDALFATVLAIQDHYPSWYKSKLSKSRAVRTLLTGRITGRIIKLRRIALSKVSRFL